MDSKQESPTKQDPEEEFKPAVLKHLIDDIKQNLTMDDYFAAPGVIDKSE